MASDANDRVEAGGVGCGDVRMLMSAEIDGAATEEERGVVALHVQSCGACSRARDEYAVIGAALAEADVTVWDGPTPSRWAALEARLASRSALDPAEPPPSSAPGAKRPPSKRRARGPSVPRTRTDHTTRE